MTTLRFAKVVLTAGLSLAAGCGRTSEQSSLRSTGGSSIDQTGLATDRDDSIVESPALSVDIKANGEDGPIFVAAGASVELSWKSEGASFCTGPSSYSLEGKKTVVIEESVSFTFKCMNGKGTTVDTVEVKVGNKPGVDAGESVDRQKGLNFCDASPTLKLRLDLARPKDQTTNLPALIFVHGGAWQSGSRTKFSDMIDLAATKGFVAVTIDYRQVGSLFPGQVEDVKCAVRWLRSRATDYGIDKDRIGIMGVSAGAHLAMLAAFSDDAEFRSAEHPGESSRVQAVVNWAGPVDMAALFSTLSPIERTEMTVRLGGTPTTNPAVYAAGSPITHLTVDDPPTWTTHGAVDPRVPKSQADALDSRAKAIGAVHTLEVLPGQGHIFNGISLDQAVASAFTFFNAKLKP